MVAPTSDQLTRLTRLLMAAFVVLTALAVLALFVGAEQTERTFAWTIDPPATAAFLGAGYFSGTVLVALSWAAHRWSAARVPMIVIGTFTVLTLLATLLHLDRFHFAEAGLALFNAWLWLAVYVVVPPAIALTVLLQERRYEAPTGSVPMPRWLRTVLLIEGIILLGVGGALFVAPATAQLLWPWALTPLTARAVGAWLLSYGLAAGLLVRANDLGTMTAPAVAYGTFGAVELIVAARYAGAVNFGSPQGIAYLATGLAILVTGVVAYAVVWGAVHHTEVTPRGATA